MEHWPGGETWGEIGEHECLNFDWPRAEIAQQLDVWGSVAKRVAVWTRVLAYMYSVLGEPYPSLTPFPYTHALALADLHDCRQLTPGRVVNSSNAVPLAIIAMKTTPNLDNRHMGMSNNVAKPLLKCVFI